MNAEAVRQIAAESLALKQRFFDDNAQLLVDVAERMCASLRQGGRILVFGNGGSAADAQHFAGELVGRFLIDRQALPALALTTDPSIMTAIGNDLGFDVVFRRQLEAHGRKGDVAVGITTSGNSPNVVAALAEATQRGLVTVGLTGNGGGKLKGAVDHLIDVPHRSTPRIQEVHGMVVHLLCQMVEEGMAR
jgi:D-sedoheptulose 7-phosphate isomerase